MAQVSVARGWKLEVDRGPDWLFVRPRPLEVATNDSPLAEQIWALLERSLMHRLVLELDGIDRLDEPLIAGLSQLKERIAGSGGMMRICGLSARNERLLRAHNLAAPWVNFRDCESAVKGEIRSPKPR